MRVNCRVNAPTKHRLYEETSDRDPWLRFKNVENGIEYHNASALDKRATLPGSSGYIGKNPAKKGDCRIMYQT